MTSNQSREMILPDSKNGSLPIFNFSFDDAVKEVQRHLSSDRVFDKMTEMIIISVYSTLIISGILSNLTISGIIVRKTRVCNTRYPFVVNLSVSDLILCAFCMPFSLLALVRRRWFLGLTLCKLVPFVQGSTVFLSSATVSAIAIDRYKHVLNAFPSGRTRPRKEVVITIVTVWIMSLLLSSPVPYAQTIKSVGLPRLYIYEKCIEEWPWDKAKGVYTVVIVLAQFLIPWLVLTATHMRIEAHLKCSISRHRKPSARSNNERMMKERNRNRRATCILMMISTVFGVTWLPWNIFNLIADFYPKLMDPNDLYLGFVICHMIAMTSTTTNPILYGWFNSNIRREILVVKRRIGNALTGENRMNTSSVNLETVDRVCDTRL